MEYTPQATPAPSISREPARGGGRQAGQEQTHQPGQGQQQAAGLAWRQALALPQADHGHPHGAEQQQGAVPAARET